jgi:alginate O-acetyltransferase complex protein AlgI
MQFTTLVFAAFFLLTLTLYWALARWRSAQKILLLLASYGFYGAWSWKLLGLLIAASLFTYLAGEGLARCAAKGARRAWITFGVIALLALLGCFKYYGFFSESLNALLGAAGLAPRLPLMEIILPVGISFYTFQALAYLLDIYWKRAPKARSMLDCLLYMAYFPKLLSGPLARPRDFLKQLEAPAPALIPEVTHAGVLILSGLAKKVVLAALIDIKLVSDAFADPKLYSSPALWAALLGYAFLLYWDFSGYTDIALGASLLLGIRLPENFNHPYVAKDISDFWRRWHISLSAWLREYLYGPLGGLHIRRRWFAVVMTMVIAGLWHGAGWTYVLWGLLHGVALFCHHGLRELKLRWKGGWLGRAGTFLLICLGWLIFRCASLPEAWAYFKRLFSFSFSGQGFSALVLALLAIGVAEQLWGGRLRQWFEGQSERLPWALRPALWLACGLLILLVKPGEVAPYIYFGF